MLEFRPEQISRRGEATIWVLALVSLATVIFSRLLESKTSPWNVVFLVVMVLSGAGMTLGNWMDRKTVLIMKPEGLEYRNGLRSVSLRWDDVRAAEITPSRWGDLVRIFGNNAHFQFRTLSEIIHKGEVRNRMGFTQGEVILEKILKNSSLVETNQFKGSRYYSRP